MMTERRLETGCLRQRSAMMCRIVVVGFSAKKCKLVQKQA